MAMSTPATKTKTTARSLPHQVSPKLSLRPSPKELEAVLDEFGHKLVMKASDECRVLPHILHLIGKGGEHIVFEDLRFPNYVLKVDFIESLPVLYAQTKGGEEITKAITDIKHKADQHRGRIKGLQSYFLPGQVPIEMVFVKELPLSQKLVQAVLRDRNIEIPKKLAVPEKLPVLCTLQRKIELPKKENRIDVYSSYAELNRTISLDNYTEGHRLLASAKTIGPQTREAREKIIGNIYPSLKKICKLIQKDDNLRLAVQDYVKRAMKYSADTNEIIDMAGGGNVMFLRRETQIWQAFLMDALSPAELNFDLIRKSSLLIKHNQDIDIRTKANTLNVINYIRFANALAMISGISTRLEVPGMVDIPARLWHEGLMIEKYLDVYTPKKASNR
ncbi:hypothetical protein GF391_01165 [Candidatus Uhrbacteria bacterium]|nr:hypothetical protein [Candidatus Uhrbacteria bacterium]